MARKKPTRAKIYIDGGIIAPVKGWTSQKSLAEAEPDTAVVLDNFFPEADAVRARRGCTSQATGIGAAVDSVFAYSSKTGGNKLFAAKSGSIYDVTAIGAVGAAVVAGLTNGKWQTVMFSNAASQFLTIVNGADGVRTYDGAAWTDQTAAITGTGGAVNTFIGVCAHQKRLWFFAENSTDAYYLAADAINGAALKFGFGSQFTKGGKIIAMATWSSSQGNAMDDRLVVASDQGEVLIYAGTDPAGANTWALVVKFTLAVPMGARCLFNIGADLAILTVSGLYALSQVIEIEASALSDKAFTKRIRTAYTSAVLSAPSGTFGWCITTLPSSNMAIVNVPISGAIQQFVLNTVTGAWCRFTGWNARCWTYFNGAVYYGDANGKVLRAEYGPSDNGVTINAIMVTAFNTLKYPGRLKDIFLCRPILSADVQINPSLAIAVDYIVPTLAMVSSTPATGTWFTWGTSTWGGPDLWRSESISISWNGVGNVGTMIAIAFGVTIDAGAAGNQFNYRVIAFNLTFEVGNAI